MKAQLLKTPMTVTVRPIKNYKYNLEPPCSKPEFTPFKEESYEAVAHAFWYRNDSAYVAISREGKRLLVTVGFFSPWAVKEMGENLEKNFLHNMEDVNRYGLEAFAEDALLMDDNINVEILSVTDRLSGCCLEVESNHSSILNGHVKPMRDFKQIICFSIEDPEEIIML